MNEKNLSTVSPQASLLEQMGHFFLPLDLGWYEQTVKHLDARPLSLLANQKA